MLIILLVTECVFACVCVCRFAGLFTRSRVVEFQDDWETVSPSAGTGTRLLRQELENHNQGLPPGLTAMPTSNRGIFQPHPTPPHSPHPTPSHHPTLTQHTHPKLTPLRLTSSSPCFASPHPACNKSSCSPFNCTQACPISPLPHLTSAPSASFHLTPPQHHLP